MNSNRELLRRAVSLLAKDEREAAKGVLMQMYLHELGKLAYKDGTPTMPIYEDDLRAAGVSINEFKELCDELPGMANPFSNQSASELTKRGCSYCNTKEFEKALELFDEAIALDESFIDAWYSKAGCLCELERIQEAKDCYSKVLQLNPADRQAKEALEYLR